MVECLSLSTLDFIFARNLQWSSKSDFTSQEALVSLQKCKSFKQVKQVHARVIRNRLGDHQLVVAKMLRLCSSFGELDYATATFQQIENPSTFVWNLLIRTYVVNDCSHRAILLYNSMVCRSLSVDKFTFPFVMKACLVCCCVEKAKEVYGFAIKTGFCGDVYLDNVMMDLYLKCGVVDDGLKVFDKMRAKTVVSWTTIIAGLVRLGKMHDAGELFERIPVRNIVTWTAMINAHARSKKPERAFDLFAEMQHDGVKPNEYTMVALLMACVELGSLKLGRWVHNFALKNGFEIGVFLGTALIDMYSKCGSLEYAMEVFESMESKSVATWNTMITGLGVHGRGKEGLALFREMERMNVKPDEITLAGVLCALLQMGGSDEGGRYFDYMTERYGIKPTTTENCASLVVMYSRADELIDPNTTGDVLVEQVSNCRVADASAAAF